MPPTLAGLAVDRLERSCRRRSDSIRFGPSAPGEERAEVYLSTCAFEPHRHDTYAIGVTTAGVQTFRYRGSRQVCLPTSSLARSYICAIATNCPIAT